MDNVNDITPPQSTIGRTNEADTRQLDRDSRRSVGGARPSPSKLTALLERLRDPLGVAAALDGWQLDEKDIRADLEYGWD